MCELSKNTRFKTKYSLHALFSKWTLPSESVVVSTARIRQQKKLIPSILRHTLGEKITTVLQSHQFVDNSLCSTCQCNTNLLSQVGVARKGYHLDSSENSARPYRIGKGVQLGECQPTQRCWYRKAHRSTITPSWITFRVKPATGHASAAVAYRRRPVATVGRCP